MPNLLSLSRAALVAPIAYLIVSDVGMYRWEIAGLICIASLTDYFDGYFARKKDKVSELGKILDPVADKIASGVICIALVIAGRIPLWFTLIIIARDLLIVIGSAQLLKIKKVTVQSNKIGKWTVTVVAFYILSSIILPAESPAIISGLQIASLAMITLSLVSYLRKYLIEIKSING